MLASYRQALKAQPQADKQLKTIILQALAHQAHGNSKTAVQHLEKALTLAEPSNFIRIFIDEGQPLAHLLTAVPQTPYVTKLQAAFAAKPTAANSPAPPLPHSPSPLIDPLSDRELEILTHIAAGLKNKEIAAALFVSINTVHYHTKNLYGKLGVNNRTQAIAKAQGTPSVVNTVSACHVSGSMFCFPQCSTPT